MKPEIISRLKTGHETDHAATGAAAKAYRESKRVKAREVAAKFGFADATAVSHMEAGRTKWTPELLAQYCQFVDDALAGVK